MNMKHFGTATAIAVLLSGAQAFAATIVIDTFDTDQSVSDVPAGTAVNTSTVTGSDILGGTRTLTANNTAATGTSSNATALDVANGVLAFSNKAGAKGSGTLFYNGGGLGLGNIVAGTNSRIFFDVAFFDNDANVDITVNGVDADGTMISYMENVAGGSFSPFLSFTQFSSGNPAFDFTNVKSLEFMVDTTGRTANIDGILNALTIQGDDQPAPVPLPAAGFLLLGGLGGLAALRRRRKA